MPENPFGLRVATPADAAALVEFVLPIFAEEAAQKISVPKITALVQRCVAREGGLAAIVSGPEGEIEASVGATVEAFDYTDDIHLMVRWLGVAPALRNTDRPARLLNYVQWLYQTMQAESDAAIPVFINVLTTSEQRRKVLLYQRRLPMVGALHALGCLPDRTFFNPSRAAGKKANGARQSQKGDAVG